MRKLLVLGATSTIVSEALKHFAASGDALFLVARDRAKLLVVRDDLLVRGASQVEVLELDLCDYSRQAWALEQAQAALGDIDHVIIGYGVLGDQPSAEREFEHARQIIDVNFCSVVSWLTRISNLFEESGAGVIAVIGSVAGDRGRAVNYVYGASKGALDIFLSGLRNRLAKKGVAVVTIKPGFVKTPMTAHLEQGALFAEAVVVGEGVFQSIVKKKDLVYLPWFWRYIMLLIKIIPESVFKRLRI